MKKWINIWTDASLSSLLIPKHRIVKQCVHVIFQLNNLKKHMGVVFFCEAPQWVQKSVMSTCCSVTDSLPNTLWKRCDTVNPSPSGTLNKVKLICKYLTRAWYKNKPSSSRLTLRGPAWHSLNPMDDSEPCLAHRSCTQRLVLKSCDWPFVAALNCLSSCQHTAQSSRFTQSLSLNFWPLQCLPLFDKTPLFEICDYRRCSGQFCHAKFTCLVFIVWLSLPLPGPHT